MLFSSMIFLWCFLPITLICYYLIKQEYKNYILLIASIFFYAWGEPVYILLMLFSIVCNYSFGICMDKVSRLMVRKFILTGCILINIGILWYFKYSGNCISLLNKVLVANGIEAITIRELMLPIGISFYTFQAMSYVIDLYRKEIPVQKNILQLALYISFFPQLIAGPIVKYKDVNKQLTERYITEMDIEYGIKRFIYGLGKKVVISNTVAEIADNIFLIELDQLGTVLIWFGIIMYTIQIYFDFSGYSDMAIGLGRMFGFKFTENFDYPYISKSIKEFWRRWHISLSGWFRDYIYIPLGGNRKGKLRTYINLFIVFLLTGIWHGASLNFLCWGLWHGGFIIFERLGFGKVLEKNPIKILNHIYTMFVVIVGWAMFRCASYDTAVDLLCAMFQWNSVKTYSIENFVSNRAGIIIIGALLGCGVLQYSFPKMRSIVFREEGISIIEEGILIFILLLSIVYLVSGTYNPFIYFQF